MTTLCLVNSVNNSTKFTAQEFIANFEVIKLIDVKRNPPVALIIVQFIGKVKSYVICFFFPFFFLQTSICGQLYYKLTSKLCAVFADILYDSWSPAMTVSSICISILSMLSSSTVKVLLDCWSFKSWFALFALPPYSYIFVDVQQRPADNDRYVKNCRNGRSPKETRWWFHDDKV